MRRWWDGCWAGWLEDLYVLVLAVGAKGSERGSVVQ